MKEIIDVVTNPIVVQLEIGLIIDLINIIDKSTHGYSHEIISAVRAKLIAAKTSAENREKNNAS